ncbi:MAG: hypothetical protein A4E57_00633 [Syntrophorhabdaceae bacterium PtaU1.Bin034]|nr:MAG: hypothetical protein A4E57_00633 [Syntrophorhabdaceae bacterium PtaU1.Bin034]
MRTLLNKTTRIRALCVIAVALYAFPAPAGETHAQTSPCLQGTGSSSGQAAVELGQCRITVLSTYFWRDWMPMISRPGPDRGSPLRAKVKLWVENKGIGPVRLSYKAVVVDDRGASYPVAFRTLPNFRVLPEEAQKAYRGYDAEAKKEAMEKYNVVWDGVLKKGEGREVEIMTSEGPYLPAGSRIHVEITWTDEKGNSAALRTPDDDIKQTH